MQHLTVLFNLFGVWDHDHDIDNLLRPLQYAPLGSPAKARWLTSLLQHYSCPRAKKPGAAEVNKLQRQETMNSAPSSSTLLSRILWDSNPQKPKHTILKDYCSKHLTCSGCLDKNPQIVEYRDPGDGPPVRLLLNMVGSVNYCPIPGCSCTLCTMDVVLEPP